MLALISLLLSASAGAYAVPSGQQPYQQQHPGRSDGTPVPSVASESTGKLHGRFMHITDLHADPHYKIHTSVDDDHSCHRGKGPAGEYGAETTSCDSPFSLVDGTFKWIEENLKDTVDFVIWTGDSARHDNDEKIPRTEKEVLTLNQYLVDKFLDVFGKVDNINDTDPNNDLTVPIIPTFGNNDILPHNVLNPGPNKWTKQYGKMWENFIPEEQKHVFERGGWFFVEVIPDKLAVFSLNTMYFYDANAAVDGCDDKSEPGYEHFEWLRIQLQFLRNRGMKAIITGHVPPARTDGKQNWDETCWQKYALWMQQYRDVVITSVYGHMNIDHFMLLDRKEIDLVYQSDDISPVMANRSALGDELSLQSTQDYLTDLRDIWSKLPRPPKGFAPNLWADAPESGNMTGHDSGDSLSALKKKKKSKAEKYIEKIGGPWAERFMISLVAPSVVPNYFPSIRIFEYNLTGLDQTNTASSATPSSIALAKQSDSTLQRLKSDWSERDEDLDAAKKRKKKPKKPKKPNFIAPDPPSDTAPPGPAYSPQALTLLGYTQYFANLTYINSEYKISDSQPSQDLTSSDASAWMAETSRKKDRRAVTMKKPSPRNFTYEVEYNTLDHNRLKLPDLTVLNYLHLATRMSDLSQSSKGLSKTSLDEDSEQSELDAGQVDLSEALNPTKKKHRNKKKSKKKSKEQEERDETWIEFVKRVFVNAVEEKEIRHKYGSEAIVTTEGD